MSSENSESTFDEGEEKMYTDSEELDFGGSNCDPYRCVNNILGMDIFWISFKNII